MEELKLLIGMVNGLPTMALWVLIGYLIYKLAVIGSIFGVARFAIAKFAEILALRAREKTAQARASQEVEIKGLIEGVCITQDNSHRALYAQLDRLRGKGVPGNSQYIHGLSVTWLREAIDAKEIADKAKAGAVNPIPQPTPEVRR